MMVEGAPFCGLASDHLCNQHLDLRIISKWHHETLATINFQEHLTSVAYNIVPTKICLYQLF